MTTEQLEDDINQNLAGDQVRFNADGSGSVTNQNLMDTWNWSIINGDNLYIVFNEAENDAIEYEGFNVTTNEMYVDTETTTFDEETEEVVRHFGRFYYN